MIAFCGLNCAKCPAFKATQADDDEARARTAAFYAKKYGFTLTPDQINCDGCKAAGGRRLAYCRTCDVRKCGMEKGLENCVSCPSQPCDKLSAFHAFSPDAKAIFDALVSARK